MKCVCCWPRWILALVFLPGCVFVVQPSPKTKPQTAFSRTIPVVCRGPVFYVEPEPAEGGHGTPQGDGSKDHPWDLHTAIYSAPAAVVPGSQIWVRGGMYYGGFLARVQGTAEKPVCISQYPGERVRIDSNYLRWAFRDSTWCANYPSGYCQGNIPGYGVQSLVIEGGYTQWTGFEVFSSDALRISQQTGSFASDVKRGVITPRAPHIKIINFIIHDLGSGIFSGSDSPGSEYYGNIIFNNGWYAADRAHGHGMYVQNAGDLKLYKHNLSFNNFCYGTQLYGSSAASLANVTLEENAFFNNGTPVLHYQYDAASGNYLPYGHGNVDLHVGGGTSARNVSILGNFVHGSGNTRFQFGYGVPNYEMRFEDNVLAGYGRFQNMRDSTFLRNFILDTHWVEFSDNQNVEGVDVAVASEDVSRVVPPAGAGTPIPYLVPTDVEDFGNHGTRVSVLPNAYELGRGHVVIYNWKRADTVDVDLSSVLEVGARFEVLDAENVLGSPVVTGTYSGNLVQFPMTSTAVTRPLGNLNSVPNVFALRTPPHSDKRFGAFLVRLSH